MNPRWDYKDYCAEDDPFQLIEPDMAIFILCCMIALGAILWPYF